MSNLMNTKSFSKRKENKQFMKLIIAGRTGSGKTTLAQKLSEYGLSVLKTHTTRPKRKPNEDGYIFIDEKTANNIPDKILETEINGYKYFATTETVEKADILVLDPNGVRDVSALYPDTEFALVYAKACDKEEACSLAAQRESDYETGVQIFQNRYDAEDDMFTEFEKKLQAAEPIANNIKIRFIVINDFNEQTLNRSASEIIGETKVVQHMTTVLKQLANKDIIPTGKTGIIATDPKTQKEREFNFETIAITCLSIPERMSETMSLWLSLYDPAYAAAPMPECDSNSCAYCTKEGRCGYERIFGEEPVISEDIETGCSGFFE